MILWLKGVAVISTRIRNHKFRPKVPVSDDARSWWKYAFQAVLHKIRPNRYCLEALLKRFVMRKHYFLPNYLPTVLFNFF